MSSIALAFCTACVLSLVVAPLVKRVCDRLGLTDCPDSHRKLHQEPVALGGGIAVFITTLCVAWPLLLWRHDLAVYLASNEGELIGLLLGGTIILFVGVLDDAVGLRGRQKLAGQLVACSLMVVCGFVIERLQFFGWRIDLGLLSIPVTILWFLAAINAINLLDGINGLATTIGIIDSLAIMVLATVGAHRAQALVAAAFAGSLLGFLRHNFPRAKMFLGDAGSMLIGLMVGGLAVQTSLKGPGTVLLATPLCLMTIPLFDSLAAMLRRRLTGRSIFSGDRAHLHHRLMERFGNNRAVGIVAVSSGVTAVAALTSMMGRNELVAVVSGVAIVVMLVVSKMFGHAELRLLASHVHAIARSFLHVNGRPRGKDRHSMVHVQGNREWERVWTNMKEAIVDLPVETVELCVNAPMIQEGYHASWTRGANDVDKLWRFELPLIAAGHRIGHIRVAGERTTDLPFGALEKVLCLFDSFESQLATLFVRPAVEAPAERAPVPKTAVLAGSHEISGA